MNRLEALEQQLRQAQERCKSLANQLEVERTAAQADLAECYQQQAHRIQQLETQVDRLQWMINASPTTTYTTAAVPPYACTYVSQSLSTVLGYTPEEFQAEPALWQQRLHPEDAPQVFRGMQILFEQGYLQHKYRVRHRDGHYVWVSDERTLRRDAQGNPQEVVGYFTDIREHQHISPYVEQDLQRIVEENRQFCRALQAQESTYRYLFDYNPQPLWVYDLETLSFLAVNEAAIAKYGYSKAEFLAMTIADIRPAEEVPRLLDNVAQVSTGLDYAGVWQHRLKHGQIIQVEIISHALTFEGRRAELVMAQDVTERVRVGQALYHSEERYRLLVEFAPQLIWSADAEGLNTYASKRMSDYIGLPTEQIMAFDWHAVIHPDDLAQVHRRWMASVQTGMPYEVEYRLRRADGVYRWHLTQAIRVQYGQDIQWLGMATDIHDRKQAELALQNLNQALEKSVADRTAALLASEAKLQAILHYAPLAIYVKDLEGRRTLVNQAWLALFDYTQEEVIGKTNYDLFPQDIADTLQANDDNLLVSGEVQHFEEVIPVNGENRVFLSHKFVLRDAEGKVYGLCGMSSDITARQRNEALLKRQLAAIEAAADGIAILQDGAYLYLNRAHLEMFGYTHEEMLGQPWTMLYSPEELARLEQAVMPILGRDGTWCGEAIATRKDGTTFDEQLSLTITEESLLICVCADISERKRAEFELQRTNQELERATRIKDEFLANMSHELRTPLNAILGMTEGLQEEVFGPITESQHQSLSIIERSGNHLLSLINDILDLSKIEAGQLKLSFSPVGVSSLCHSSLAFVSQQAHKKNLQIVTHIPKELPDIYGDERRLRQVMINLLTNAVKFTPAGGRITLSATYAALSAETPPQAWPHPQADLADTVGILTLAVVDTGIGIAPENVQKLFQPFTQIDTALNRQHEGTGLGLALVKRITEMHGGQVDLTSEVGHGSCFTIRLPILARYNLHTPLMGGPTP